MWLLTYRDKSPLRADDWLGFRDPDEITYRKYVTMQDQQETAVEVVLDEYGPAQHDASLSDQWAQGLAALFTPTRFPIHALQMCTAYLAHMAPASYISNCAVFGTGDLLRWWHTGRDSSPTRPVHPSAAPSGPRGSGTKPGSRPGESWSSC
jgi:toluene monooxygenase system protein E